MALKTRDLEVDLKAEHSKAIIAGKTSIPFKTFVGLVLQRKVLTLFKDWGTEPVIIDSELLTSLASAPQDSQENRAQLVLVTLGVGVLCGVFLSMVGLLALTGIEISYGPREFILIAGGILALGGLAVILSRIQRRSRAQKIADAMEKVTNLLAK